MRKLSLSLTFVGLLLLTFIVNTQAQEGTKITQTTLVETKLNSVLHINCFGDKKGAINIMVSGGQPPYFYQWSNGETTQDIAGLEAGTYTVRIVDALGCPDSLTVEVKQPEKLKIKVDSVTDILCFGSGDGGIDVSVEGGVPPYLYSWSDESTAQDLRNALAGEYALLVTDANHCQEIASAEIKQNPLIVRSDEKIQNVECSGDSTGTIDIRVKGGVPPYSYWWTSGERQEDLYNLPAGTYTVQVTDARGCLEAYSTKIVEPNAMVLTLDEYRDINCAGDNSGAIGVSVKGGVPPYSYAWNDSLAYTQDLAGLGSGVFNLVVTDDKGCEKYLTQEIQEPEKLEIEVTDVKNVLNYGGSDGAIYINVTGGVTPYKYAWSNGPKTQNIANIPANSYTCRVIDQNKCVNTVSVNIDQPALLEVEIANTQDIRCNGETNGLINVEVRGGVTPYKYTWSNGDTTKNIDNLPSGAYSLTVTDAHGMEKTVSATINQPTTLTSNVQSITDNLCFGDRDGIVDINVQGGTPPYNYNWSNGSKTQDIAKVPSGVYLVQIVDKNQCSDSLSATVDQPDALLVSAPDVQNIKCFGKAEGIVNIEVKGGVSPYSYTWNNGADTRDLTGVTAGAYNLKVTDSKGCSEILDVRVTEPPLLETSIIDIVDVKCKGDSTGSINLSVNGGTSPYVYKWSDGRTLQNNANIGAGSYSVSIEDAMGCINTLSATVTEPSELYSVIESVVNVDCYGENTGAVDVTVGGGVSPYMFAWNNNATTQNLMEVAAGEYSLSVTDQNGCKSEVTTTVVENDDLIVETESITHVLCNGLKTGAAVMAVKGGVEPYLFKWSNGAETKDLNDVTAAEYVLNVTDGRSCVTSLSIEIKEPELFKGAFADVTEIGCHGDSNAVIITEFKGGVTPYKFVWNTNETTKDIRGLKAGQYSVLATDANGCEESLEIDIVQPSKLELSLVSVENNPCWGLNNGAIDIAVVGGVTPYTYEWSNSATTQDLTQLAAGKYLVNVTGATGCTKRLDAEITQPEPLQVSVVETVDVNCFGGKNGSVDVNVTGGKEPYIYSWSNGETTQDISEVVAGSYTINVQDANGCVNTTSALIKQPEPLEAVFADVKNINCHGDSTGAIAIDVTGGTLPYSYNWSNGASIEDISNLKIGDYSVDITDAKGCSQSLATTITQPELLVANVDETVDVLCNGFLEGSIDISVSGGVTPYVYNWSNESRDQDIAGIGAGLYDVTIQDANGCIRNLEATIAEPEMLVVSIADIVNIKEFGRIDGSISITVGGGTSPYAYSWSNGATSQNIEELVAGDYSVIVNDANGCRQDLNASIIQPEEIQLTLDSTHHIRCYGEETGFALVSAVGGVAPYGYSWSNGFSGNQLDSVPAGEYTLTVTDANKASKELVVLIDQPEYFDLSIAESVNPTCYELNNGRIKTIVTGGTTPYVFSWNNGASTQDLKGLTSGNYALSVTDARGCSQRDSVELTKPEPLEVLLVNTDHIKCYGEHKGNIDIDVKGGTAPYQFSWSHGAKEQNLTDIMAGNYTVKVTDANKCLETVSATVNQPPALVSNFAEVKNVPCQGDSTGLITTLVTGGLPPYSYAWSSGDSTPSIQNLPIGKYSVAISDLNGCSNELTTTITEPLKLTGLVANVNDINCFGEAEGAIAIEVKGGTTPYRFGWNNGSKDQNLSKIPAGDYTVNILDNQGCEISLEASVKQPTELAASVTDVQNILCYGDYAGSVDVDVTGGIEPYAYSWSNGNATQDIINVPAGDYSLKVSDARGCFTFIGASVEEPQPLVVENTSVNNNRCSGQTEGAITISVKGGVAPYDYKWDNGATTKDIQAIEAGIYNLELTDANGCVKSTSATIVEPPVLNKSIDAISHISCNGESDGYVNISVSGGIAPYTYQWSNGHNSQDLLRVPAGEYSVLIKEANGCESTLSMSITEPTPFITELLDVEHNKCFGDEKGSIEISADGGTTPYSFSWSNGEESQNLKDIVAGNYSVLVSDANGCNKTIKTTIEEPSKLVLKVDSARNVKCCGDTSGAIFISVNGGVGPYQYLWSHGATSQDITGLAEGQYTVSVTDQNGCVVNTPEEGATIYEKIISQGKFVSRDILFDVGKATIKEKSFIEISRIASFMKEHPTLKFSIEGHTDSQGDATANQRLSEQRAEAIKESLIKFGIQESRLTTKGWGESKPVDTNATQEGRAKNRRVEFIPM